MSRRSICAPLFLAVLSLAACAKKPAPPAVATAPVSTAAASPTSDRYLEFFNLAEPEYIDPGMVSGQPDGNVVRALFEGLLEYDPKDSGKHVPGVAETYDLSPDGLVYTFHLRSTAKWSDGSPLTAQDFLYSWERVLNPKTGAPYAYIFYYIKNGRAYNTGALTDPAQLGFKAPDAHTIQVTLEHPTPFFPQLVRFEAYRPVPQRVVEQFGTEWTKPEHILSNGAFTMQTWVPNKEITVVKNPHYWDAANVKLPGVRLHPIEDKETAFKMYESGQLDVAWELPAVKRASLLERPDMVTGPYLASYFYRMNVTQPPLDNPKVRQALAMAIDRQALAEQYLQKTEIPSTSLTPRGLGDYVPPPGWDFNPAEAKKLLTEAGYPDPSAFPPLTFTYNTDDKHKLVAQVVQQMWKQHLGIQVTLQNEEWKTYLKTMDQLHYQIIRAGWIGDYVDPTTFLELFTSTSGNNRTGWKNAEFDGLIAQVTKEPNVAHRNELMQQAEALLLREAPIIQMFTYKKMMLIRPYVKGFYPTLLDIHPLKFVSLEGTATARQ
ncbi:MAG: peptide ABC transporter substrate-binding protein [Deltaproteobacteria bacterium]|nr:peptide ABC transporter substrate-binding protein [Deltaproteobacteria bacterium]